jgi:hypothetical protein
MNSMAFLLLANSNREVDESQEKELTFGSLSFYIGPSGSTRLSDPMKPIPSAGKAERTTTSGSSVGSSSEVNSLVSLAATENLLGKLEEPEEIGQDNYGRNNGQIKGYRQQKQQRLQERTLVMRNHH